MKQKFLLIFSLSMIIVIQTMAFWGNDKKAPIINTTSHKAKRVSEAGVQVFVPVEITGFNADVIANGGPAESGENIAMQSTTVPMSIGTDLTFYSQDYRGANNASTPPPYGLPADGIIESLTIPGVLYHLADYSSNNALLINYSQTRDTIYFAEPASFNKISLLTTSTDGYSRITTRVLFEDHSFQENGFVFYDWFSSNPYAVSSLDVVNRSTEVFSNSATGPQLFDDVIEIEEENASKKIVGVAFWFDKYYNMDAQAGVFAVCGMNLPGKPVISAINVTETSIIVSWDSALFAESYKVQFSIDSTFLNPDAQIVTYTDITDTTFTIEGLIPSPVYYARVIGYNAAGNGPASDVGTAVTSAAQIFSVEPSELQLTSANANYPGIQVNTNSSWNASSPAYWLPDISGAGSKNLVQTIFANVTTEPRAAKYYFYSLDMSDTISVSQPAMDVSNLPFYEDFELATIGTIPHNFAEIATNIEKKGENNWEVFNGWSPETSNHIRFNDYENQDVESRLAFPPLNFENFELVILKFNMVQYYYGSTKSFVRIQGSNDHMATWKNLGDSIPLYNDEYDWEFVEQTIDLSEFAGQPDVNISLFGSSDGSAMYMDDFRIIGYNADMPFAVTLDADNILGDAAMVHGEVSPNLLGTTVYFEYGLSTDYQDSINATPNILSGIVTTGVHALLKELSPETTYHYRIVAINDMGTAYGDDMTFTTGSAPVAPSVLTTELLANDGNNIIFNSLVNPGNGVTLISYLFGADSLNLVLSETTDTLLAEGSSDKLYTGLTEQTMYYYKVIAANSADTVYSELDSVFSPKLVYDTLIDNNVFFKGRYLNMGISELGTFGSSVYAPADMHANIDEYGYSELGFTADRDKDGWYNGTPGFNGDYFLPGSPEEGWGLNMNGIDYNNNQNDYVDDISGSFVSVKDSANVFIADWEGEINGLLVRQRVKMPHDSLFFTVEVSLRNNNASTLHNIYYLRNVDPDNEERNTGNYTTINKIEKQNPDGDHLALVSAIGTDYGTYLGLGTNDARARAYFGGFNNREPKEIFDVASEYYTGDTETDDIAIAISFRIDSLASGECTSLSYAYILDESQLESALRSTLLSVSGSGNNAESTTLHVCKGSDIPLVINNGEDYEWTWEPSEGLSATSGSSITAQNVTTARTYTATGVYECFVQKFTIELIPVEIPVATISNMDQEIASGSTFAAMVLGTSNNVTGTTFNWTRTEPEGITTTVPVSGTGLITGDALEGSFSNATTEAIDVVFTVTPFAPTMNACAGNVVVATITVNPVVSGSNDIVEKSGVYPNPVQHFLTINSDQAGKYSLMSINGNIIQTGKLTGDNTQVDMSTFPSGVYILHLETGNEVSRIKVIKE